MEIDSPQSENCRTYETRKKNKDLLCRMCGKRASKQTKDRKGKLCSIFVSDILLTSIQQQKWNIKMHMGN